MSILGYEYVSLIMFLLYNLFYNILQSIYTVSSNESNLSSSSNICIYQPSSKAISCRQWNIFFKRYEILKVCGHINIPTLPHLSSLNDPIRWSSKCPICSLSKGTGSSAAENTERYSSAPTDADFTANEESKNVQKRMQICNGMQ